MAVLGHAQAAGGLGIASVCGHHDNGSGANFGMTVRTCTASIEHRSVTNQSLECRAIPSTCFMVMGLQGGCAESFWCDED